MKTASSPMTSPITTKMTIRPAAEPNTIGSARLFCWLTSFATIRICFSRPAF